MTELKSTLLMSDGEFVTKFDVQKPRLDDTDIVFYSHSVVNSAAAVEIANKLGFKWLVAHFVCFLCTFYLLLRVKK